MVKVSADTLPNGLKVCSVTDSNVGSVTFQLRGKCGSNYEKTNEIGAAHLAEHLILNSLPKSEILSAGGKVIAATSRDDVLYLVKVLKSGTATAISTLAGVFTPINPTPEFITIQKNVVLQEIARIENMPEKYIGRLALKTLYPNDRLAILNTGTKSGVARLERRKVTEFIKRMYRPENFVLVAAGNIEHSDFTRQVTETFQHPFASSISQPSAIVGHMTDSAANFLCRRDQSYKQAHLRVDFYGYPLAHPKKLSAEVLAEILDRKLMETLTASSGIAYNTGCYSFSSLSSGYFGFYAAFSENNLRKVCGLLQKVYETVLKNGFDSDAVDQAKRYCLANFVFNFEKNSFRADVYSNLLLLNHRQKALPSVENFSAAYAGISEKELFAVAKELFHQHPKVTLLSKTVTKERLRKTWFNST